MNHKKTIVIGASPNPERYSYKAVDLLNHFGYELIAQGVRDGNINGIEIVKGQNFIDGIHTVTLYIGPDRQVDYYDYILSLKPKRIIFNPGTENHELYKLAQNNGIETIEHCTLVMLNSGLY